MNGLLVSASSQNPAEFNLVQTLLSDYNVDVRPVHDPSQTLEVSIGIAIRQIIDVVSPCSFIIKKIPVAIHVINKDFHGL